MIFLHFLFSYWPLSNQERVGSICRRKITTIYFMPFTFRDATIEKVSNFYFLFFAWLFLLFFSGYLLVRISDAVPQRRKWIGGPSTSIECTFRLFTHAGIRDDGTMDPRARFRPRNGRRKEFYFLLFEVLHYFRILGFRKRGFISETGFWRWGKGIQ